jgi:hypothetical protein
MPEKSEMALQSAIAESLEASAKAAIHTLAELEICLSQNQNRLRWNECSTKLAWQEYATNSFQRVGHQLTRVKPERRSYFFSG